MVACILICVAAAAFAGDPVDQADIQAAALRAYFREAIRLGQPVIIPLGWGNEFRIVEAEESGSVVSGEALKRMRRDWLRLRYEDCLRESVESDHMLPYSGCEPPPEDVQWVDASAEFVVEARLIIGGRARVDGTPHELRKAAQKLLDLAELLE